MRNVAHTYELRAWRGGDGELIHGTHVPIQRVVFYDGYWHIHPDDTGAPLWIKTDFYNMMGLLEAYLFSYGLVTELSLS